MKAVHTAGMNAAYKAAERVTTSRNWRMRSLSTGAVEDISRSAPFHLRQPGTHPGDTMPIEGLRMSQFFHHPVMLDEVLELFTDVPPGALIDATLGGAGHSSALLQALPQISLLGIDRDEVAIAAATERLSEFGERVKLRRSRFDELAAVAAEAYPETPVVGVLFDLGVSSPQLDVAGRGFSYRQDGPLDMRMDRTAALTAADVVNTYDTERLTRVLRNGGEERFAGRIARRIVDARPLSSTLELAEIVRNAIPAPARRRPGDPAKRTFQAIRLEVNGELDVLPTALDAALEVLAPGGRCVVLSYHSGEDRLVKSRFVEASTGGCVCPPGLPCVCGAEPSVKLLTRGARKPSTAEIEANSRAGSARLRAVEAIETSKTRHKGDGS